MKAQHLNQFSAICIAAGLMFAGIASAETPPANPTLSNMRAFPTSLKDAKFQTPLSLQIRTAGVSFTNQLDIEKREIASSVSKRIPSSTAHTPQSVVSSRFGGKLVSTIGDSQQNHSADRVQICQREAQVLFGGLAARFGKYHQWLVVEGRDGAIIHAAGLGTRRGVPGAKGQTSPDLPYTKTFIVDHRNEPSKDCRYIPGIDPLCVKSQTPLGKSAGPWIPLRNDCNTFVRRVIDKCEKNPIRGPSRENHDVLPARRAIPPRSDTPRSGLPPAKPTSRR